LIWLEFGMKLTAVLAMLATVACATQAQADAIDDKARDLVRKYPLVDGHIDVPYRLQEQWADVTKATDGGDFDYPRAVSGGLNVPFMSIYTPAEGEAEGTSYELANHLIDSVEALVARAPDKYAIATSPAQVMEQFEAGQISLALGMENGSPIEGDLDKLRHFHERGVRYITLAHSLSNHISDSSYDEARPWKGLSPFGEDVVREMNTLGIMVDISHLSDEATQDVLAVSKVPVIASHSSLRHFTPGWERNMSDDLVKALAANGGVVMINFGSAFLTESANVYNAPMRAAVTAYAKDNQLQPESEEVAAFMREYRKSNPYPYATVADVADHIDRVRDLVGVEYVGLGSDYDGVGDSLPAGLKDVASYSALVAELLRRSYSEQDIAGILGGNALRVWQAVDAAAAKAG
jgi:membrane dipeptidase